MRKPIHLVEYDPGWAGHFAVLRAQLAEALGDLAITIEHIGSTAIPGCSAKPIIDIDVVIPAVTDLPQAVTRLASLGYIHEGDLGIAGREAFITPPEARSHHLYVCTIHSEEYRRHLRFRDYLRAHPEAVQAYSTLKQRLAQQFCSDRAAYSANKDEFVATILQRASIENQ